MRSINFIISMDRLDFVSVWSIDNFEIELNRLWSALLSALTVALIKMAKTKICEICNICGDGLCRTLVLHRIAYILCDNRAD